MIIPSHEFSLKGYLAPFSAVRGVTLLGDKWALCVFEAHNLIAHYQTAHYQTARNDEKIMAGAA